MRRKRDNAEERNKIAIAGRARADRTALALLAHGQVQLSGQAARFLSRCRPINPDPPEPFVNEDFYKRSKCSPWKTKFNFEPSRVKEHRVAQHRVLSADTGKLSADLSARSRLTLINIQLLPFLAATFDFRHATPTRPTEPYERSEDFNQPVGLFRHWATGRNKEITIISPRSGPAGPVDGAI